MTILMTRDHEEPFYTQNYDNEIYFYTIKDKIEFAFYDKRTDTLFFNSDYRNNFSNAKAYLKKKYKSSFKSEYCNMRMW